MHRSVYSLVLGDDVVAVVDTEAARLGMSRSAFVEQVLAEAVKMQPPGRQAQQILLTVQQAAGANGLRMVSASQNGLTLRTALCCKYNPALHYTVQLQGSRQGLGQLRVALRSQNTSVLDYFALFLQLWQSLEQRHLKVPPTQQHISLEPKRYLRTLRSTASPAGGEDTGNAIAAYIDLMDGCMRAFFQNLEDAAQAVAETETLYLAGLKRQPGIGHL